MDFGLDKQVNEHHNEMLLCTLYDTAIVQCNVIADSLNISKLYVEYELFCKTLNSVLTITSTAVSLSVSAADPLRRIIYGDYKCIQQWHG